MYLPWIVLKIYPKTAKKVSFSEKGKKNNISVAFLKKTPQIEKRFKFQIYEE